MPTLNLPVEQETDLALVVGRISRALRDEGVPDEERVRVLTATMELARNIVKYARRGEVRFGWSREGNRVQCWIEAEDEGPGIADVQLALRDNFSTGKSLGLGLPGVRRLMDKMEIRSQPGVGTWVRTERSLVV